MSKHYLDYNKFDLKNASNTGGVTGSKKVKMGNTFYQLKPSIQDASITRRIKAGGLDKENFGEFIAANISKSIVEESNIDLVPEVSLVYNNELKRVLVASRYLENVEGTLDDFGISNRNAKKIGRHVVVSTDLNIKDSFNLDQENDHLLRRDLAQAIGISILCGDHDINPGNMLVLKDSELNSRIARIDFGHAFNDLLNAPEIFGGKVRDKQNLVLDFLNRQTVAHFPSAGPSKLWRSYQGIVPSKELIEAFYTLGNSKTLSKGLYNAKLAFNNLIDIVNQEKESKVLLDHIKNSLIGINNNISNNIITNSNNIEGVLDSVFKNIELFYQKNQQDMLLVSKLMDLQVKIDQLIIDRKSNSSFDSILADNVFSLYQELLDTDSIGDGKKIKWIKSTKNIMNFDGTLEEFMQRRMLSLGLPCEGRIKDFKNFIKTFKTSDLIIKDVLNEASFVGCFFEESLKLYLREKKLEDSQQITRDEMLEKVVLKLKNWLELWQSPDWLEINAPDSSVSQGISDIAKKLETDLNEFIIKMDSTLTQERNLLIKKQGVELAKAEPKELIEMMNKVSIDNIYIKTKDEIFSKGHLVNSDNDTIWKTLSNFCSLVGLKKLKIFCDFKNEETKVRLISKRIGLATHAVEKVVSHNYSENPLNDKSSKAPVVVKKINQNKVL